MEKMHKHETLFQVLQAKSRPTTTDHSLVEMLDAFEAEIP